MGVLLLAILVGLAIAAVRTRDLLAATAILGAYSLMMALLWCTMNALDVAFTEAAVGAGISTVLMLAAISRVGNREQGALVDPLLRRPLMSMHDRKAVARAAGRHSEKRAAWGAVVVCALVALALLDGTWDMPHLGDATSPANANKEVSLRYIEQSTDTEHGLGMVNIVTSVLGDYRGYDTMGETVVIFTAALCVLMLLRNPRKRRRREDA
jgi:multicomponent Na+:H+ antiporter subunit B